MKRQIVQINQKFINSSYFVHKYLILYNQFERTHTEDVVMTPLHIKFFHNNRPGNHCRGTPRFRAYLKYIACYREETCEQASFYFAMKKTCAIM